MPSRTANTPAFINDNDFAFTYDAMAGKIVNTGVPERFLDVTLAEMLPTTPDAEFRRLQDNAKAVAKPTPGVAPKAHG